LRRFLRLLNKSIQKIHATVFDAKKNPGNRAVGKIGADLENAAAHGAARGHANGPPDFHGENVVADKPPMLLAQTFEPIPDGFVARWRPLEPGEKSLVHDSKCTFFGTGVKGAGEWGEGRSFT
jgi:hypothetical protein